MAEGQKVLARRIKSKNLRLGTNYKAQKNWKWRFWPSLIFLTYNFGAANSLLEYRCPKLFFGPFPQKKMKSPLRHLIFHGVAGFSF